MSHPFMVEPGMRYSAWFPAEPVDIPGKGVCESRFASGAFDSSVGKVVGLTADNVWVADVRVISAEVSKDGTGVTITYEVLPPVEVQGGELPPQGAPEPASTVLPHFAGPPQVVRWPAPGRRESGAQGR
jgi:hypothetical protein